MVRAQISLFLAIAVALAISACSSSDSAEWSDGSTTGSGSNGASTGGGTTTGGTTTGGTTTGGTTTGGTTTGGTTTGGTTTGGTTTGGTTPPPGSQPFATRCVAPGVIKCVSFDSAADIAGGFGSNSGIFANSSGVKPAIDTTVKASGAGSLMFTIPANSSADSSGSYFTNFSPDLLTQFGANAVFYVQWRQRFSPEFINTFYTSVFGGGANGWKQVIVGAGDQAGGTLTTSCTELETVVQNTYQTKFPQMYNSCSGSTSHGAFYSFEEPFGNSDFKKQNARPSPFCLYSQGPNNYFPPNGNCFGYVANEWMTFQVRIQTGPRLTTGLQDEWINSLVTLWVARFNSVSEKVIEFSINLSAGDPSQDLKFGKVWLLPYHTNKDPNQTNLVAHTWYDELIISTQPIADAQ